MQDGTNEGRVALMVSHAKAQFKKLRDSRSRHGRRFVFVEVIVIGLMAMICGSNGAEEMADWAELHEDWLGRWFDLKHGTPSQDTFLRIFEMANPKVLSEALRNWLGALRPEFAKHIAIDGKALRGTRKTGQDQPTVFLVNAWLREAGLVLGQVKTDDKSNEMKAIPALLKLLDIADCTVTVDAAGCQKDVAAQVVAQQGHYVVAVKGNQPTLHEDIEKLFTEAADPRRRAADELARPETTTARDVDSGHGRIEERTVHLSRDLSWLTTAEDWKGLCAVGMVESKCTDEVTGKEQRDQRYYIVSDPTMTAERLMEYVRRHWSVENELHWVLDVEFGEDRSRIRQRNAAENFGALRRMALSLLKSAPAPKKRMSISRRRNYCDHSLEYLCQVLATECPPLVHNALASCACPAALGERMRSAP
jgi:predicted transposase YbfD/YdcC